MSHDDLERFYAYASRLAESSNPPGSLEAALAYWRAEAGPVEPEPFPAGASLADRLEASGVLGASDAGPPDLSTNPVYMQGFGES